MTQKPFVRYPSRPTFPRLRGGAVEFERVSRGLNPTVNGHASPAPTRKGWWCCPAGSFDWYFAFRQLDEVLPKRLKRPFSIDRRLYDRPEDDAAHDWLDRNRETVLPRHHFWWSGPVWARFDQRGRLSIDDWYRHPSAADYHVAAKHFLLSGDPDSSDAWLSASDGKPSGNSRQQTRT